MGDLTVNFSRGEFACRCKCGADTVDYQLLAVLQMLRKKTGRPITINCGIRCKDHNRAVGGAEKSLHLSGKAADIFPHQVTLGKAIELIEGIFDEMKIGGGIGLYKNFIHIDVREGHARWTG